MKAAGVVLSDPWKIYGDALGRLFNALASTISSTVAIVFTILFPGAEELIGWRGVKLTTCPPFSKKLLIKVAGVSCGCAVCSRDCN